MEWNRGRLMLAVSLGGLVSVASANASEPLVPEGRFPQLSWRLLGPFRGGWSTVAVGVPEAPDTYYFGAAGGGVWKTTDSGRTWACLSDGQPITAVGALAVAPSDPNVLYVGTGHPEPRYDIGAGSGVYRSGDGGRTWQAAGLKDSRHIGALLIDRRDANRVLVAALGHVFGPHPERGVFRTEDGGKTWARTLFVDEGTGAVDLAVDPGDPEVVFAVTWTARVWPWLSYFTPVVGPGSAVHRSTDGGRTWTRLGGEGWPQGPLGRIGLAVTRAHGATRLYASVSGGEASGLYRSDDGGARWQKVHAAGWLTSWYMSRMTVSPVDPDVLYTAGQSIHVSRDGGKSFRILRGAPGGDDFHGLWINPTDPRRMVAASDQGTIVTVNGGASWSDWYNQPTGQFYSLATDDRFPYWVYSGQQDSGTVRIASRGDSGALGQRDWHPVGGDERDVDLPDPEDPSIVFGSGLGGRVSRWNSATGEVADVSPWPISSYGRRPSDFRYHYTWFTPLAFSRQKPHALYAGSQVLFRSLDRGAHWEVVSPDLSGRVKGAPACEGDPTPAQALACGFGVINTIAPAPGDGAELWVGTDDGHLWLTLDGTAHWTQVTPPGVPPWAKVSSIDLAAGRPGVAYVAVDNHRQDDAAPHVYRTTDHGATWVALGGGLPPDHFVSVVRADPVRPGLLYAGTEVGVQVSLDDGGHWQPLPRNLPPAWVHDLLVKGQDLIVATVGRGLWVLDDVSPLRQLSLTTEPSAVLYRPAPAYRLRLSQNRDTPPPPETPLGRNPPTGAVIDYWLPTSTRGPVQLEVRDPGGALVRRFSSADQEAPAPEPYFEAGWLSVPNPLPAGAGAHRFVWNLRAPRPRAVESEYSIGATRAEGAPLTPSGALVPPGEYRLTLTADGVRREAPLKVSADPRTSASGADLAAAYAFSGELATQLERAWRGHAEVGAVEAALLALGKTAPAQVRARLEAFGAQVAPLRSGQGEASLSFAAASGALAAIATDVDGADRAPSAAQREAAALLGGRVAAATTAWRALKSGPLSELNRALATAGLAPIRVPDAAHLVGAEAPQSQDLP